MQKPFNCLIILILIGLVLPCATAAEWQLDGNVKQMTGYDDNVRMQQQAEGSFEYLLTPKLNLARKDQDWDVAADASYGLQQYTDIEGLDYLPQNYTTRNEYRTARTRWGLAANYADTLSRNNALQDTGNFATNSNQVKWAVSPNFSYSLNQQDSIALTTSYSKTAYSGVGFNSNDGQSGDIAWQRQWSERLNHSVSAFYSRYQFTGISNSTSDSYGVNVMSAYRLSQIWSVQGTVGGRITNISGAPGVQQTTLSQQSSGFLGDIALNYKGEQLTSSIKLGRSLVPSSQGNINEQTQLAWNAGYALSKRWQAGISASYQISKAVSQNQLTNNSFNNRNNLILTPSLDWTITPEWVVQFSYRYRQQDSLYLAESNALMLTITYNWLGFSVSR